MEISGRLMSGNSCSGNRLRPRVPSRPMNNAITATAMGLRPDHCMLSMVHPRALHSRILLQAGGRSLRPGRPWDGCVGGRDEFVAGMATVADSPPFRLLQIVPDDRMRTGRAVAQLTSRVTPQVISRDHDVVAGAGRNPDSIGLRRAEITGRADAIVLDLKAADTRGHIDSRPGAAQHASCRK